MRMFVPTADKRTIRGPSKNWFPILKH